MIDIYTKKENSKDWIIQNDLYFNLNTGNEEMPEKETRDIMPGGAKNMKWESRMIYKNIIFEAALFSYELSFDNRITLVGGDSGTGKTVLYDMLEDLWLTDQYHATRLFNYKSDNLEENLKKCRNCFIVIDNADILMDDEIRRFINFEFSNQYMLFLRNCDGLNVSDKSFKVMSLESNKITLKEREIEDGNINTIGCCAESIG